MKSIRRGLNCPDIRTNAKHQTFNWLLLASAPQSGGDGLSIHPPVEPGEARRARGKDAAVLLGCFFAAERQNLRLAHCIPSALCFARPCDRPAPAKSTVARCCLCTERGKADQRRAWRRRPPHRRATIRSWKPKTTVCWLRSLRPNSRIPLARLLLYPSTLPPKRGESPPHRNTRYIYRYPTHITHLCIRTKCTPSTPSYSPPSAFWSPRLRPTTATTLALQLRPTSLQTGPQTMLCK